MARQAARVVVLSDTSDVSAGSESDGEIEEMHVMDPSDPRAHRSRATLAKPTRERSASPTAGGGKSRWDSEGSSEVDEDLGEPLTIAADEKQEEAQAEAQAPAEKPAVKISSWARARFFAPPGERHVPQLVEDPPLEPLNDYILSDFGSRFRGATGDVEVEKKVDLEAGSDEDESDDGLKVGAPLFSAGNDNRGLGDAENDKGSKDKGRSGKDKPPTGRKRPENRYFVTDLSTKCYNCGQIGHMSNLCVNDKVLKPCYYCALRGHSSFACPNLPCSACLRLGHEVWECTNKRLRLRSCTLCGRAGHDAADCSNCDEDSAETTCVVCTRTGHLHCVPVPPPADRRVYCPHCGGNHALNRCNSYTEPAPTAFSRNAGRLATQCFRCQEYGHMAADCPERQAVNYSVGNCFKCGRHGHFASECTSNTRSSDSRVSGRKRGRESDDYASYEDTGDDDGSYEEYYEVPGRRGGGFGSRGNGNKRSFGAPQLDQALPSYRSSGSNYGNRSYNNNRGGGYSNGGDQRRRRR